MVSWFISNKEFVKILETIIIYNQTFIVYEHTIQFTYVAQRLSCSFTNKTSLKIKTFLDFEILPLFVTG